MACTGGAVISLTSYPYTVCTRVSCQAVSPTNGLGTRLDVGRRWVDVEGVALPVNGSEDRPNG